MKTLCGFADFRLRLAVMISILALGGCAGETPPVQEEDPEIAALEQDRTRFAEKKHELVSQAIKLEPHQQDAFWREYINYEGELKSYYDEKYRVIRDYAKSYETMTDDIAESLAERSFKLQQRRLDLTRKYFKSIRKAVSATVAVRFLQLENQINLLSDLKISNETPLIALPEEPDEADDEQP